MTRSTFRFAPSPNGHLHLGHAYSALLIAQLAKETDGRMLVRIEDIDSVRCTRALALDALEDLAWLDLKWEEPVRYQSEHLADYRSAQARLDDMQVLYPCFCSRREVAERCRTAVSDPEGQPVYDGFCRHLSQDERRRRLAGGESSALRLDMSAAVHMVGKGSDALAWGDIILVRRDIGTSYHVAVVVDDALQGVTDVVRGRDLEMATSIHVLLQKLLELPTPRYVHHHLITDEAGQKLAKSTGSRSLRALRDGGITSQQVRAELGFK